MLKLLTIFLITSSAFAATELAKINDKVITLEDFNSKYKENLKFFNYKSPTKKNILEDMIKRDLGVQEAKKLGLDKDPAVQERLNTVLYHYLLDKKIAVKFNEIQISDKEVESYYSKNPEIRTSHIFVQVRFDANSAQEKAALEKITKLQTTLKDEMKKGKTFAEVAHAYSEGVAAATGGDIDYQTKDKLDPAYYDTAVKLGSVGNMSGIVRTQFGYHIIKLTGMREFKDVDKGHYKRIIFDEKRAQIYDAYLDDLKKKAKVSINYNLIKD